MFCRRLFWWVCGFATVLLVVGLHSAVHAQVQVRLVDKAKINQAAVNSAGALSVTGTVTATPPTTDPCDDPAQAKSSKAIASTADTEVVAASGSTVIYICHWDFTLAGTGPTARWIYGTGTVCATGLTALTGAYAPTTATFLHADSTGTLFKTIASQALCLDLEGTTPSAQGLLTYVQE